MNIVERVPSVNFHLWEPCNMKCGFCFATFQDVKHDRLPKGHMNEEDCIAVVEMLARAGFAKINFAGGEPTLCPWLSELIAAAREHGLTTAIVTNGTKITAAWLDSLNRTLDWIALSVDTLDPEKLKRIGRVTRSGPMTEDEYLRITESIKERGIRFKINTVVTSETWEEDFTEFITRARPERWKILQVLPVEGQNDGHIQRYAITKEQFATYVARNRSVEEDGIVVVPEDNEMMTGSYVMVDPSGRFFDNTNGSHNYSEPIIDVGVDEALKGVSIDPQRFLQRGGRYDWGA